MGNNEIIYEDSKGLMRYKEAVEIIKTAILQSQYEAAKSANEKQLMACLVS